MIRQPLGVCAIIAPFNFPGMIPFWFLPYAIACGNTVIVKPSERVPLTMQKVFELLDGLKLPAGRRQPGERRPRGGERDAGSPDDSRGQLRRLERRRAVRLLARRGRRQARAVPGRRQESGGRAARRGHGHRPRRSSPTARSAAPASAAWRRRWRSPSAKPPTPFTEAIARRAPASRVTGYGLEDGVQMGPVITPESRARIEGLIEQAVQRRRARRWSTAATRRSPSYGSGNFVRPTVLEGLPLDERDGAHGDLRPGAVRCTTSTDIDEAIALVNSGALRQPGVPLHRRAARARASSATRRKSGNIGINVGVAAPMAFFPFSGARESFFGDLHGQGRDAIEFFTQEKVVVERWPKEWSRKF